MQEQVIKQFKEFLSEKGLFGEYIKMITPEKRAMKANANELLHLFYWCISDVDVDLWSEADKEWWNISSKEEISVAALYDELTNKEETNMKPELTPEQLGERALAITGHPQFCLDTKYANFKRLMDGELSHVGDWMVAGEKITYINGHDGEMMFGAPAINYSIKQKNNQNQY